MRKNVSISKQLPTLLRMGWRLEKAIDFKDSSQSINYWLINGTDRLVIWTEHGIIRDYRRECGTICAAGGDPYLI